MTGLLRIVATAQGLALVVFLFAGCGGSDTAATTAARTSRTAQNAAGTGTSKADDMVGQVVVPGDLTPMDFKDSIESRRPIVVTFYMSGPADDNQVRSSITSLESKFRGQIDFYDYLYSDAQRYGDLTLILHVTTTPTVIIINEQAKVHRAWSGYVDIKSIEQGINEVTGIAGSSSSTRTTGSSTTRSSTTGGSTTGSTNTVNTGSGAGSNGPIP
ncbi:MAG: thioredoxin domain-containing protein [Thermoleophilia bacterium]